MKVGVMAMQRVACVITDRYKMNGNSVMHSKVDPEIEEMGVYIQAGVGVARV